MKNNKLFNCNDCDNLVSRNASSCPKCGCPISSVNDDNNNTSSITEDTEYDSPVGDFFSGIFSILFWGILIDLIIYFFFLPETERDAAWAMIEAIRDEQELGFVGKLIIYLLIAILPFIALWNYLFG